MLASFSLKRGCGCSSMVERWLPKPVTWVRFPSPAPTEDNCAGWSSQVARRAHNPEVAGSNPVPATNIVNREINL